MPSNVTCRATDTAWAANAIGQDACQQYAALLGVCDPSFLLTALAPSSPPYLPPSPTTGACACNLVAYNLASACRWCQDTLQPLWWATQAEWTAKCASLGQPFVGRGLPSIAVAANLTVSDWALNVTITNGTWDPTSVGWIVAANNPSRTDTAVVAGGPNSMTSHALAPCIVESGHPTPSSPLQEFPHTGGQPSANAMIGITIGVILLTLFLGSFMAFLHCRRRKDRKAQQAHDQCSCKCHNGASDLPEHKNYADSISSFLPPLRYTATKLSNEYVLARPLSLGAAEGDILTAILARVQRAH